MTTEQSRLEIGVYALIAIVAGVLAGLSIHSGDANGAAAWSALLMAIVNAIKEARQSRTIDRMGAQLATSAPTPDSVTSTTVEGTTP